MARLVNSLVALVILALLALGAQLLRDPYAARRSALEQEIATLSSGVALPAMMDKQGQPWVKQIATKRVLWKELVEPPKKPAPPKALPKPPDIQKKLEKVYVSRQRIGVKIQVFSPAHPNGTYLGIGEQVAGCTLESFDDAGATFSVYWPEGDALVTLTLPRK